MDFICEVCNKKFLMELLVIIPHTEKHIIDVIKKEYPLSG